MSQSYDKPLPTIDDLSRPFWDHARAGRLAMQVCSACGYVHFPPTPVCPKCLSDKQEWQVVSGRGTLISWAVFHRAYWDGFKKDLPYPVCMVQLDEGPVVAGNFAREMTAEPVIGMALEARFEPVTDEVSLLRFTQAA